MVEFPTPMPPTLQENVTGTPDAVLVHVAYVYLFITFVGVVFLFPIAKIALVAFPAAEPPADAALATATPQAVLAQVEKVYLFLIVEYPQESSPSAKMARVPSAHPSDELAENPNPKADPAPLDIMLGIRHPFLMRT
jgi:hypothetical protein